MVPARAGEEVLSGLAAEVDSSQESGSLGMD